MIGEPLQPLTGLWPGILSLPPRIHNPDEHASGPQRLTYFFNSFPQPPDLDFELLNLVLAFRNGVLQRLLGGLRSRHERLDLGFGVPPELKLGLGRFPIFGLFRQSLGNLHSQGD